MAVRRVGLAGRMALRFLRNRDGLSVPTEQEASGDVPLSAWREGEEGVIVRVVGNSRLASRLRELGVVPDVRVRVLRTGCPTILQVEEGRFCIRRRDAQAIRVRSGRVQTEWKGAEVAV